MPGTEIFIANGNREVLPANERGEIIIAGPNVSAGLSRIGLILRQKPFFNTVVGAHTAPATLGSFVTICFFFTAAWMSKSNSADIASSLVMWRRISARWGPSAMPSYFR